MEKLQNVKSSFDPNEVSARLSLAHRLDLSNRSYLFDYCDYTGALNYSADVQSHTVTKRYYDVTDVTIKALHDAALEKFLGLNRKAEDVNHMFLGGLEFTDPFYSIERGCESTLGGLFGRVLVSARGLIKQILGPSPDFSTLWSMCKHGPGVTVGVPYSEVSVTQKFRDPISGTERAIEFFINQITHLDSRLLEAIQDLNGLPLGAVFDYRLGSKATTVPKNDTSRRMIAIEPTVNMFLQQGLMEVMYERLRCFDLDVGFLPERHRDLARRGSLDNSLATIDFSSASDSISYELVRWILPSDWFNLLDLARSPNMEINGEYHELNVFSTMGNGTTFPLETLIFYALACSCLYHHTPPSGRNGILPFRPQDEGAREGNSYFIGYDFYRQCSVFGDDCILPSSAAPFFKNVATECGFSVNIEKSFWGNEHFRESCGGDFFHGRDTRPYQYKPPHNAKRSSLEPWLYTIINNLLPKYITYFGGVGYVYDKELFKEFAKLCVEYKIKVKLVPDDFPDDAGLKISSDFLRFQASYPTLRFSPVSMDEHGTSTFLYCKFAYRGSTKMKDALRYALHLKRMEMQGSHRSNPFESRRKVGGYVVARASSFKLSLK